MTADQQLSFGYSARRELAGARLRVVIRADRPTRRPVAGELREIRRGEVQMIDRTRAWRKYEGRIAA